MCVQNNTLTRYTQSLNLCFNLFCCMKHLESVGNDYRLKHSLGCRFDDRFWFGFVFQHFLAASTNFTLLDQTIFQRHLCSFFSKKNTQWKKITNKPAWLFYCVNVFGWKTKMKSFSAFGRIRMSGICIVVCSICCLRSENFEILQQILLLILYFFELFLWDVQEKISGTIVQILLFLQQKSYWYTQWNKIWKRCTCNFLPDKIKGKHFSKK